VVRRKEEMFTFDKIGVGVFFLKIIDCKIHCILYQKISDKEAISYANFEKNEISSDQAVFTVIVNATLSGLAKKSLNPQTQFI